MSMTAKNFPVPDDLEEMSSSASVVLEEIEDEEDTLNYGKTANFPVSPELRQNQNPVHAEKPLSPDSKSPLKTRRDFGNISPISDLVDDDDLDVDSHGSGDVDESSESSDNTGKVTPEPGHPSNRASFPRISDGRSSPILAYSPSLIKSPSSNSNGKTRSQTSPSTTGSGGIGKRPRNIARMLDNISDHSSGEEEVNNVGVMMAKFSV